MIREAPTGTSLLERHVSHTKISDTDQLYSVYEFQDEIGRGSFGIVVSVIEKHTLKRWAIKIVNKVIAGPKLTSLTRETQLLKCVDHPNIIHLERIYETSKKLYLVFEICSGELSKVYMERKPFTEKIGKKMFIQLINAVAYLHKRGIVHRDIKMENILIAENPADKTDEYYIKLTDFGLSIRKTGSGVTNMLQEFCGTLGYMAPEMFLKEMYSELCDVWATGIILYMLLFGRDPFYKSSLSEQEIVNVICHSEPSFAGKKISPEAKDLLQKMLNKDPILRITSLQILEHPYISEKHIPSKDENILNFMKKWRMDMLQPAAEDDFFANVSTDGSNLL